MISGTFNPADANRAAMSTNGRQSSFGGGASMATKVPVAEAILK